jgi:hypothetical protein
MARCLSLSGTVNSPRFTHPSHCRSAHPKETIARKRVVRQSTPAQTDGGMVLGGRNLPRCFQARPKSDWKVRLSPAAGYCFSRQRILWVNDIPREPSGRYSRDHTCCAKLHSAELAFKLKGWTVRRICIGGGTSKEMLMTQQFPGHVRSAVGGSRLITAFNRFLDRQPARPA